MLEKKADNALLPKVRFLPLQPEERLNEPLNLADIHNLPRAYLPGGAEDMGRYASLILRIIPGLPGGWQAMGRRNTTCDDRLRLEDCYLSNWSLWLDGSVLINTFWITAAGNGA